MCVIDRLGDTWICSSDNYFTENVFDEHPACSQYSAEYADGEFNEYCLTCDKGWKLKDVEKLDLPEEKAINYIVD